MRASKGRVLCLLCVLCMAFMMTEALAMTVSVSYESSDAPLLNPYIGNVAWATDTSPQEQPFTMVYADITWAQLEPSKGVYDFAAVEKRINLEHWRAEGMHVVLRFVLDKPGEKTHRDIPEWLYEETRDGQSYSISYGRGYNPNYENEVFIQAHARAIEALGERYGNDPAIAYVQLGSLGHWGEWHVHSELHPLPMEAVRDRYVAPYVQAFPQAKLMMRRPFTHAARYGTGLFNDTSADPRATGEWLDWIAEGGRYNQTEEEDGLVPMPDAWRTAPIGGELSTSYDREDLLDDLFEDTLDLFERSHTSWVGPGSFVEIERDGEFQDNLDTLLRRMGYRLRISRASFTQTTEGAVDLSLTWHNDGIAPFYFDWQPTLLLRGPDGSETRISLDIPLIEILPDVPYSFEVTLAPGDIPEGECEVFLGIVDPATGEAGVALAMETVQEDGWYLLASVSLP